MNRRNVKILMAEKGVNFATIANELHVIPQTIYQVICGRTHSRRVESALEEIFSLPIAEIRAAWNTLPTDRPVNVRAIADRVNREFGRKLAAANARYGR